MKMGAVRSTHRETLGLSWEHPAGTWPSLCLLGCPALLKGPAKNTREVYLCLGMWPVLPSVIPSHHPSHGTHTRATALSPEPRHSRCCAKDSWASLYKDQKGPQVRVLRARKCPDKFKRNTSDQVLTTWRSVFHINVINKFNNRPKYSSSTCCHLNKTWV